MPNVLQNLSEQQIDIVKRVFGLKQIQGPGSSGIAISNFQENLIIRNRSLTINSQSSNENFTKEII